MKVKIKKSNKDGVVRLESSGDVNEIWINEDFLHPQEESIAFGFRGEESSGIVELKTEELEMLYDKIRSKIHLIKGFKRLSGSGARRL